MFLAPGSGAGATWKKKIQGAGAAWGKKSKAGASRKMLPSPELSKISS